MRRKTNPMLAALYGALVALVVAYAISYVLTRFGMGVVISPDRTAVRGPAVFARAGLNLCAMHCVPLIGEGTVTGELSTQEVSARVVLPLTIWAAVPALALLLGGYVAARSRLSARRWTVIAPAVVGGVLYVAALAVLSRFFESKLDSSVLPTYNGTGFNPPDIAFRLSPSAVFAYAIGWGVLFGYLGALVALRRKRENGVSNWWACGKAAIIPAILLQILAAGALNTMWAMHRAPQATAERESSLRMIEMLPAAAGMLYTMSYGSTLKAGISAEGPYDALDGSGTWSASLFHGAKTTGSMWTKPADSREPGKSQPPRKPGLPQWAYAILLLPMAAMLLSGVLAVRWGSRDGSLPTALRIAIVHGVYLAALIALCRLGWDARIGSGDLQGEFSVFVAPAYDRLMLVTVCAGFVLSFIGARLTRDRRGIRA